MISVFLLMNIQLYIFFQISHFIANKIRKEQLFLPLSINCSSKILIKL